MFMPRAAGAILLAYALFNTALGLNRHEPAWLLSAVLLAVAGAALILARANARVLVFASAAAAAGVGVIGQVGAAIDARGSIPAAVAAWALWSSLWLATAWIGAHYLRAPADA